MNQKYGVRTVTVTQDIAQFRRHEEYRRKTAAFEEWRQKLNKHDRLPRGRFFKGKKPGGRKLGMLDEFWLLANPQPRGGMSQTGMGTGIKFLKADFG